MGVFGEIRDILMVLLDVEAEEVLPQSYLVQDLGVESIDFLELAVALNEHFHIKVQDDTVFLRSLRFHLSKATRSNEESLGTLKAEYVFLSVDRLKQILLDLDDGPVIQVQDLVSYVKWQMTDNNTA